jgi:hypothetical protein
VLAATAPGGSLEGWTIANGVQAQQFVSALLDGKDNLCDLGSAQTKCNPGAIVPSGLTGDTYTPGGLPNAVLFPSGFSADKPFGGVGIYSPGGVIKNKAFMSLTDIENEQASGKDYGWLLVSNSPPSVTFVAPEQGAIFAVNTTMSVHLAISDPDVGDEHRCVVDWGDGTSGYDDSCSVATGLAISHVYTEPGVYTIAATVKDRVGASDEGELLVVAYDPTAGFVTGGGWINSPSGAHVADGTLVGNAKFGFVSKYTKGATMPVGDTQFVFESGNLYFVSTSYEWLVVNGQSNSSAQFKGSGVVNGGGNYGFMLWAKDADRTPDVTDKDSFRIKIWDKADPVNPIYDNGFEQEIGGGSIVIHTGATKK